MYLIRVIPLYRKIPDGELSYISKSSYKMGSIITVPLRKSPELAVVMDSKKVSEEKNYIKSLPFSLLKIVKTDDSLELLPEVVQAVIETSVYSLSKPDLIFRSLFGKSGKSLTAKKEKLVNGNLTIFSRKEKGSVSFHEFITFFIQGGTKVKKIVIKEPERLSDYGLIYLGFDPVVFIVILAKKLKIELSFSNFSRLRYKEWDVNFSKLKSESKNNLFIISRQNESPEEKSLALSPLLSKELANWTKENKKILIISTTKGFSPKTSCADCSTLHVCSNCQNPLRLVKNGRNYAKTYGIAGDYLYICINCKHAESAFAKCKNCDSWHLIPLGYGIERVMEDLYKILPKKKVYDFSERVSLKEIKDWQVKGGIAITSIELVRDMPECDICIIPSLAGILYGQSFEAAEKARYLMKYKDQILDKMIIFTMQDVEKSFLEIKETEWIKSELEDRKTFNYPPFGRYVSIILNPYASKVPKILESIILIIKKYAIENTVVAEKNSLGIVAINASFSSKNWSVSGGKYELAESIYNSLLPFWEYIYVKVY